MNINKKNIFLICQSPYWQHIITAQRLARGKCYLVGGTVRDLMLGRPITDIDLVVFGCAIELASLFAKKTGGGFVPLDPKRDIARVVLKDAVFDFAKAKGETIEQDLLLRDFTINAVSVLIENENSFGLQIVDPLGGIAHLQAKQLIPCSETIFSDDPLRILRAYRLSITFGLKMSDSLLRLIHRDIKMIAKPSPERIRDELFMIFRSTESAEIIIEMDKAGVLSTLFPEISDMRKTVQGKWHDLDVWNHSLRAFERLEHILNNLNDYFGVYASDMEQFLKTELVSHRPINSLIKLGTLFHDVGKPERFQKDNQGEIHFYGHAKLGGLKIRSIASRLALSCRETSLLARLTSNHMKTSQLFAAKPPTIKTISRFFLKHNDIWRALFCLYYSDMLSKKATNTIDDLLAKTKDRMISILAYYNDLIKPKMTSPPLLTGHDLINVFGLKPGSHFRVILDKVTQAFIEGIIHNKNEAIDFVKRLF
ncbi:MAG: hypothetical protein V1753_04010 [Pseudomonadota bacterium]